MKNILFIIPHPDDEIVGSCIILRNFLISGKRIVIFFLTNGVLSKESMWPWKRRKYEELVSLRVDEMKNSLNFLGVNDFIFQNIPTRTLKNNISETYFKIKKIISSKNIDTIFCPAYEGGHQDHDVANFICSRLINFCRVFEFSEYNFFKNRINSNFFIEKTKNQKCIFLSENDKHYKSNCLKLYASEKHNLGYISLNQECYRQLVDYDYSKPPHKGVLFYRRFRFFSWHPRVDGDRSELVCVKLVKSKIY